ncbi:MAG TPA: PDZ domain-containing protein [Gemmatimonadaceae bacterium]|nr:PDZ domain-containing protein [Gemmatimonadaceae bacterium]
MRSTHYVLGAAMVLSGVAPIAAQDRMSTPAPAVVRFFNSNDNDERAALGINTGASGKRDTLGLLIESVTPNSPADKAGLLEGYRIASVNGENLKLAPGDAGEPDMDGIMTRRLVRELGKVKAGDEVTLQVYADGAFKTVKVKTVAADELTPRLMRMSSEDYDDRAAVGLSLDGGGSRRDTLGLLVNTVETDGPADKAGIEEGNRIASIDGIDLRVPADEAVGGQLLGAKESRFTHELAQKKAGDEVTLQVYANGAMKTVKVTTARSADVYKNRMNRRFRINMDGNTTLIAPTAPMMRLQSLQDAMRPMEIDVEQAQRSAEVAQALAERQATLATMRARLAETQARLAAPNWSDAWGASGGKGWLQGDPGSMLTLGGLRMSVVSPELANYFGKGSEEGLLILDVNDYWHPLQAGDVILSVNGKSVRDGDHASFSLDSKDDNTFVVLRKGARITVHVKAH